MRTLTCDALEHFFFPAFFGSASYFFRHSDEEQFTWDEEKKKSDAEVRFRTSIILYIERRVHISSWHDMRNPESRIYPLQAIFEHQLRAAWPNTPRWHEERKKWWTPGCLKTESLKAGSISCFVLCQRCVSYRCQFAGPVLCLHAQPMPFYYVHVLTAL